MRERAYRLAIPTNKFRASEFRDFDKCHSRSASRPTSTGTHLHRPGQKRASVLELGQLAFRPHRNRSGGGGYVRIGGVFPNKNDVAVSNAVHPPVDLIGHAGLARGLYRLGSAYELATQNNVSLARGVDQHGTRRFHAGDDGHQPKLVDRVLIEYDLPLRLDATPGLFDEGVSKRPERVTAALAFHEVNLVFRLAYQIV